MKELITLIKTHRNLIIALMLIFPFFIATDNLALVTIGDYVDKEKFTISVISTLLWVGAFVLSVFTSKKPKETAKLISVSLIMFTGTILLLIPLGGILTILWYPFAALTKYLSLPLMIAETAGFIAVPWLCVLFCRKEK